MRRVIAAGVFGLLLATSAPAQTAGCASGNCGPAASQSVPAATEGYAGPGAYAGPAAYSYGYGYPAHGYAHLGKIISNPIHGCSHMGCGGFCFRLFPGFHQEGPLFNYGPYAGYYPFEPYGPWTSDLRYTGPLGPPVNDYGHGHHWGLGDKLHALGGHLHCRKGECGSCGGYAKATLHNVGHRVNPFGHLHHKKAGCSGCEVSSEVVEGEAVVATPEHVTRAEKPADPVVQAGYPRRER